MAVPKSTSFRDWMNHLNSPRGAVAEWPWLLRELLSVEYHRQRKLGFAYAGKVFKDRDKDDPTTAVLPEKRAVKDLYHRCRRETGGVFRIGTEAFLLLGYEWPNQGRDRGRRADLVGLNSEGGLIVFECKLESNSYGPFAAVLEGLDYLTCLTADANFTKIIEGFERWVAKSSGLIPAEFQEVAPNATAVQEVIVLAPKDYYSGRFSRSARGAGWQSFAAPSLSSPTLSLRFARYDFKSPSGAWV